MEGCQQFFEYHGKVDFNHDHKAIKLLFTVSVFNWLKILNSSMIFLIRRVNKHNAKK